MQTPAAPSLRRALAPLTVLTLVAGCAGASPAAPAARPDGGPTIARQEGWRARVLFERDDSIILTLPAGNRQLQQFHRSAVFILGVSGDGQVTLRLESLTVRPREANGRDTPIAASWTGRADDPRVNALRVSSGGDVADELTAVIRNLLPRFPAGGAHSESTWSDSAAGRVRVDIFNADERRQAIWTAGAVTHDATGTSLPVKLREDFEQLGTGSQGGQKITMTSQGSRSGTYYYTIDGRLSSARLLDSATMLISIPSTRQVVPTLRFGRASVRFIPIARDTSEE